MVLGALTSWKGFLTRTIYHLVKQHDRDVYIQTLSFSNLKSMRSWTTSKERSKCLKVANKNGVSIHMLNEYGGLGSDLTKPNRISMHDSLQLVPRSKSPAKWKLFLLALSGGYLSNVGIILNQLTPRMLLFGLPLGLIIFINLAHIVVFLIFVYLPAVQSLPIIDRWMRRDRKVEDMSPCMSVLDQGLQIFAAPVQSSVLESLKSRVDKLEQHVESLRKATFSPSGQDQPTVYSQTIDAQFAQQLNARQVSPKADDGFVFVECGQTKQLPPDLLTLACAHYVKWEHADNFRKWTEKITQEMARYPGFVGLTTIEPSNEDDPFINSFTFSNLQNLMSFFGSEVRKQLLSELEVMLQGTSIAEVARERVLGDAFSELFVSTGGLGTASNIITSIIITINYPAIIIMSDCNIHFPLLASVRRPPLWKAFILVQIPLFLIAWPLLTNFLPILVVQYKLNTLLASFICTFINILVNTYVGVPLMHAQFGDWLKAQERTFEKWTLLQFLDSGFSRPVQYVLLAVYCLAAFVLNAL